MRFPRTSNDPYPPRSESSFGAWCPPVEIFEMHDRPVLRAELLTVQREDMDVRNEDGALTLYVGGGQEIDKDDGAFTCSFSLPTQVETAKRKRIEIKPA